MTARTHKVFVYGSLLSGLYNNTALTHERRGRRGTLKTWLVPMVAPGKLLAKTATVNKWRMFDLGSFPAVRLGGRAHVKGEVWEVTDAGLAALDRLEGYGRPGGLYDRREVLLKNGMRALIYYMHEGGVGAGDKLVASGDWRKYDAARTGHEVGPAYTFVFSDDS